MTSGLRAQRQPRLRQCHQSAACIITRLEHDPTGIDQGLEIAGQRGGVHRHRLRQLTRRNRAQLGDMTDKRKLRRLQA